MDHFEWPIGILWVGLRGAILSRCESYRLLCVVQSEVCWAVPPWSSQPHCQAGQRVLVCLIFHNAHCLARDPLLHVLFANGAFIVVHEYLIVDHWFDQPSQWLSSVCLHAFSAPYGWLREPIDRTRRRVAARRLTVTDIKGSSAYLPLPLRVWSDADLPTCCNADAIDIDVRANFSRGRGCSIFDGQIFRQHPKNCLSKLINELKLFIL